MKNIILSLIALLFAVSCANTKPLRSLENNKIPSGLSAEKIEKAILSSGRTNGWELMKSKKSANSYLGKLYIRKHYLEVLIVTEKNSYTVLYNDSRFMKYNSASGVIHRNYYLWVSNLIAEINNELKIAKHHE